MKTYWILETNADPLGAIRQFLLDIWASARLDGLLVPLYQEAGTSVAPRLLYDPGGLAQADPFAPLMPVNAAGLAPQLERTHPQGLFGAVLRSCEARAFRRMVEQERLSANRWLVVGVDCLASFPAVDFEWRVSKVRRVEALTREALRFARQGGMAPYRFRDACQMCVSPAAQEADVGIELLGLPARQFVIISTRNRDIARRLHLDEISAGPAPMNWVSRRDATLAVIAGRHKRLQTRKIQALSDDAPGELESLLRHIASCAPCQACMDACPIFTGDIYELEAAERWVAGCVACGMCDEACPRHLPLTAIITHIANAAAVYNAGVTP